MMRVIRTLAVSSALAISVAASAQQTSQVQLKIESSNRTLTVSAEQRVTAEPEIAVLHIGFETQPSDAKTAYAAGAKTSNEIVAALKQAGIPETSIRSESQQLASWEGKAHKFRLVQQWVVKVPPARVAEILDVAVSAGATDSGRIEWTVENEKALEDQALEQAAARATADAAVLAKGMGVRLGSLIYVTNQISSGGSVAGYALRNFSGPVAGNFQAVSAPPLAIEPHKVSRTAAVYAVFSVE